MTDYAAMIDAAMDEHQDSPPEPQDWPCRPLRQNGRLARRANSGPVGVGRARHHP